MGKRKLYPGRIACAAPPGWRAKAQRLAAERDMGLSEWLRALLRREFERDRKTRARAAAKGGAA